MVSEQLCRDWDTNAVSLGLTPKVDSNGKLVPIGVPENPSLPDHKKRIYVVWVGRALGLYHNWYVLLLPAKLTVIHTVNFCRGLVSTLVCGFSGNAFKAYVGLENARAAWETGPPGSKRLWTPPRPGPSKSTPGLPPLPRSHQDDEDDDFEFPEIGVPTRAPAIHVPIQPEDYQQLRDDARQAGAPTDYLYISSPALSATSLSTLSAMPSTPSWMSSGTLSPGTVASPDLALSMSDLSLRERFTTIDAGLSAGGSGRGGGAAPTDAARSPAARSYTLTPSPVENRGGAETSGSRVLLDKKHAMRRTKGDPVYVVVRGEHPGVYFDKYAISALLPGPLD